MRTEEITAEATAPRAQASEVAPGVFRMRHLIVNSYIVGEPASGDWILVDAGLGAFSANKILRTAALLHGKDSKPAAIVLTHGHFDHIGAVNLLARQWQVPVYAHWLEMPYLTGKSHYPPPDPTVGGGLMARMARLYPSRPIDLGHYAQVLPEDGIVPEMPGWRWVHTPGHSPGHISLFRLSGRVLIAGDAFITVKQESFLAVLTQRAQVHGPPMYFTPDWAAARGSLAALAKLEPEVAATGHGKPMEGKELRTQLRALADNFESLALPNHGRYLHEPAKTNDQGVVSLPPPVYDRFPKLVGAAFAAFSLFFVLALAQRSRRT